MAHWCRICFRHRANEKFSGKGHKNHICKECSRRPKAERDAIDHEREICGYYEQSNISKKNLKRLDLLSRSSDPKIASLSHAVFAVGKVKSHGRKRLSFLARHHPEIMEMLGAVGLIIPPAEYRAMMYIETDFDLHEYNRLMLDRSMNELRYSDENQLDPGEIGRLLLEHSKMVSEET